MDSSPLQPVSQPSEVASSSGTSEAPVDADRGLSYRFKLVLGVCLLVLLTGGVITWLAYRSARSTTRELADSLFREVSGHAVSKTQDFVLRAAPLVDSLEQLAGRGLDLDHSDRLAAQLLAVLQANPGLSWVSYADEAGTFTGAYRPAEGGLRINQSRIENDKTRLVEHEVRPDGSWHLHRREDDSGYDPRQRPFYRQARELGRLAWTPPYVFYHQGVPGISCAKPVYDGARRLRGVVSVDFDLNALSEFVARQALSKHSTLFLFTADEVLLAHPNQRRLAASRQRDADKLLTLADAGDPLVDAFRANLRPEHLQPGEGPAFHAFQFRHDDVDYFASTTAFRVGDDLVWVVGAAAPRSDFLAGVWQSQRWALAVAAAALIAGVVLAALLARRVSGPVLDLIGFMRQVGAGDLNAQANFGGSREFRQLSAALNRMIADLRDRLRLRHSLQIAMEVQQRLLPPAPPRVPGLDIAGHSTYCDETGGDYYDFLLLEEAAPGGVLVVIGDVVGHGVAAALIMAGVRAVLRDRASTVGSLSGLLDRLNRLLAADLGGERFMTMFLCLIDARTGNLRWSSAGHDPALIFDATADRFDETKGGGLPLGILEDSRYEEYQTGPLNTGQVVVFGTDGVWEAQNAQGEQFGKDRLREVIRSAAAASSGQIVQAVVAALGAFRGDVPPADDVTFVIAKVVDEHAGEGRG
jgi:sigma-B regulation protein RsbU (phosphoserine phosphatase)